jgi:photosystem II stability/assembly factor-like uncharacterized protein
MLISTHPISASIPFPFTPVSWNQVAITTFDTSNIFSVATNNDIFVAVGAGGKLATAANLDTWTQRTSSFGTSSIYTVAFGDGKFIAAGSTGKMAISEDGITWIQVNSSFGSSVILDVSFYENNNLWVAVGGSGKLATSEDGENWVMRLSSFGTSFIRSLHSGSSSVLAVGNEGKLSTSTNGILWTQRNSSFSVTNIYSIHGSENFYVAVGDTGKIGYSSNSTSWVQSPAPTAFNVSGLRTVKIGIDESSSAIVAGFSGKLGTSFTGESWTLRSSTFGSTKINDLLFTNTYALAVGDSGKMAYSL